MPVEVCLYKKRNFSYTVLHFVPPPYPPLPYPHPATHGRQRKMSSGGSAAPAAGGADGGRPLGPDGKPLPGPQQMQQVMAQRRMAQQQAQVDEVCGIMKDNLEKVLERDVKLNELDERADALQDGASQFEKQAGKLKNKFWLQNLKSMIGMGIVGLLLLFLVYWKFFRDDTPQYAYPPPGYPPQQQIPAAAPAAPAADEGQAGE